MSKKYIYINSQMWKNIYTLILNAKFKINFVNLKTQNGGILSSVFVDSIHRKRNRQRKF